MKGLEHSSSGTYFWFCFINHKEFFELRCTLEISRYPGYTVDSPLTQGRRHLRSWEGGGNCRIPGKGERGLRELDLSKQRQIAGTKASTMVSDLTFLRGTWTRSTWVTTIPEARAVQPLNHGSREGSFPGHSGITEPPLYPECRLREEEVWGSSGKLNIYDKDWVTPKRRNRDTAKSFLPTPHC